MQYLETSAKSAENVHQAFSVLSAVIKERVQANAAAERALNQSSTISFTKSEEIKRKRCC